jgi:Protein of unknown function (DUF3224)
VAHLPENSARHTGEGPGLPKVTRAVVAKTFTGDVAGEGHVEELMMYRGDGSATFVGLDPGAAIQLWVHLGPRRPICAGQHRS